MLNWNSLTSIRYKTGLIRCLLNICSSEEQKEIEMAQLRLIFLNNNYPSRIIEFEKFLKYKSSLNKDKNIENDMKTKYISLPYIYYLRCLNCDEDYIGKTTRVCSTKMKEHEHSDPKSHVYQHHHTAGHKIDFDNVKI